MITVRTEGFLQGFLHLSKSQLLIEGRLSGQSWTNGPAESRPQRPLSEPTSLTISSSASFSMPYGPVLPGSSSKADCTGWVGLSQSVEGPWDRKQVFSEGWNLASRPDTETMSELPAYSLPYKFQTQNCSIYSYLNIQTASRPCTFWTLLPQSLL